MTTIQTTTFIKNYTHSVYVCGNAAARVMCKKHGFFVRQANMLLFGCWDCDLQFIKYTRQYTETSIRTKVNRGDTYDYSVEQRAFYQAKVNIICKTHGMFAKLPPRHLTEGCCVKCDMEKRKKKKHSARTMKLPPMRHMVYAVHNTKWIPPRLG